MHKASVLPAAALAAVFLFGFSSPTEGKSASHTTAKTAASKGGASGRDEVRKARSRPSARPKAKAAKAPKKARHVIRQKAGGAVVVERVSVESPEFYGPFLPVEVVDYPLPSCEPVDVVLEAHVHEADEETPEPETIADDMPEAATEHARPGRPQLRRRSFGPSPPSRRCVPRTSIFRT